ncbi:MAG: hypothetical protein ACP5GZ_08565 [Vulcanisaeta sp.]|uniref:hypothetical protein n=1 Tax=Vulcanisaeta sp. TaxID=2020871 RepID=UPI003D0D388F
MVGTIILEYKLTRVLSIRIAEADAMPSDAVRFIRRMQVDPVFRDLVFDMLKQAFGEYFR